MATLRAKTIKYPGAHGVNTLEATLGDENSRFGAVIYNGVVDSAGKLVSRKDFVKQTAGFSNTLKALYNHRGSNGTETVFSAAAGIVYSGVSSLTSRFNYQAGSQIVDVGGAKLITSATGLLNDASVYGMVVEIDGGVEQQISVTGTSAQTYATLLAAINADLSGASCLLVGGNLKIISDTTGASSAVNILNMAGTASNTLLSTLTGFAAVRTATPGRGSQIVDVGGAKTDASTTGLANDTTTYGFTVAVDGGAAQQVTVTGTSAQTYATLLLAINADVTGADFYLINGNLKAISDTTGALSAISISNVAGTASVALLATLSNFVSVVAAVQGADLGLDNWHFASFRGKVFFAQAGHHLTVMDESTFDVVSVIGQPWPSSPNVVMAAYGRAWAADDAAGGNRSTVWWSNLLDGLTWNSGDAGNLDLSTAWPKGQDSIVALAAAFGRFIVFGRKSIILYTLPADNDPANMTLTDAVEDLGCVSRDSVVVTDTGIYFLSDNGIYRIDKLGQTTSLLAAPQISLLYNDLVQTATLAETAVNIRGGFFPTEGLYVLSFPTMNTTFCVHTRKNVPTVERPIGTVWNNVGRPFYGFAFDKDGNWYSAGVNGVHKYSGYTPDGASNAYNLQWTGQWHPFEDESRLKHMKSVSHVIEAAIGQTGTFQWRLDYLAGTTRSHAFTCGAAEFAENPGIGNVSFGIGGSGKVVQPGLIFPINGTPVTLHQTRLYANPGKVVNG